MLPRSRLPFRITLLLWLVLIITVLNAVRMATALDWKPALVSYAPPAAVIYVSLTGAFWAIVGLLVLWSFWRGGRRSRLIFMVSAAAFAAWSWADRLFVQHDGLRANWLFDLAITLGALGYTALVVFDPRNQTYFRKETYERKPKDQPPA